MGELGVIPGQAAVSHHGIAVDLHQTLGPANAVALGQMQHPALRPTTPALMFVVTRAVMGAIRSASQEDAPVLGTPEFEEELVRMAWRLLTV